MADSDYAQNSIFDTCNIIDLALNTGGNNKNAFEV